MNTTTNIQESEFEAMEYAMKNFNEKTIMIKTTKHDVKKAIKTAASVKTNTETDQRAAKDAYDSFILINNKLIEAKKMQKSETLYDNFILEQRRIQILTSNANETKKTSRYFT